MLQKTHRFIAEYVANVRRMKQMDENSQRMLEYCLTYTMAMFRYFDFKTAGSDIKKIFKPEIS